MQRRLSYLLAPLLPLALLFAGCPSPTKQIRKPNQTIQQPQRTASSVYQEALMVHREQRRAGKKQYDSAVKLYREALSLNPNLINAHFNLGAIYEEIGRYKEAARHFGMILQSNEKHAPAIYRLAQVYVRLHRPHRALRLLRRYISLVPKVSKSPKMLLNMAAVQVESGNYGQALASARKCLAIDHKNIAAYRLIARVYLRQRRYSGVHVVYELTRTNLKKSDAKLFNIRGLAFLAQKKYPEAMISFGEAVKMDPKLFAAQMNLGTLALRYYDKARALRALQIAHQLRPRNKSALLAYAIALRANKRFKLAEKVYKEKILRLYPKNTDGMFNLAVLYLNFMNRPKEAKKLLRQYIGERGAVITNQHIAYKLLRIADQKIKAKLMMEKMKRQMAQQARRRPPPPRRRATAIPKVGGNLAAPPGTVVQPGKNDAQDGKAPPDKTTGNKSSARNTPPPPVRR